MTDNVSDSQFEEALTSAKEEGNLSRANVDLLSTEGVLHSRGNRDRSPADEDARHDYHQHHNTPQKI